MKRVLVLGESKDNKSPLAPLFLRGESALPPFYEGGQGGILHPDGQASQNPNKKALHPTGGATGTWPDMEAITWEKFRFGFFPMT